MQLVGTGLTTAFALHFGGVLEAAHWPAITCHQLFTETLIEEPFQVQDGEIPVPDEPGLGITLDRNTLERLAVDRPDKQPSPDCLIEVSWPDGRRMYFSDSYQMQQHAERGLFPYYERDVSTRVVPDDGSEHWQCLHEEALDEPVVRG